MVKSKIRKISKKCIVCGKRINLTLYSDKNYRGGYYFGTMELPFGKGEYKDLKTTKLFGKKIKITKWTGKKGKLNIGNVILAMKKVKMNHGLKILLGDYMVRDVKTITKVVVAARHGKFMI